MHDGDLNALIITGIPPVGELAEAWANIYSEYLDLNNDNETLYILQLQCEMSVLSNTIVEVETSLKILETCLLPGMQSTFRKELVDVLVANEFDLPFDINNSEEYSNSIISVQERLSPIRLRFEMISKEYSDYIASKGDQSIDKNYFDKMLSRIARFRRIPVIRATEITVKEFVLMVQDYLDYYRTKHKTFDQDGEER